jgi:hypothetical protein
MEPISGGVQSQIRLQQRSKQQPSYKHVRNVREKRDFFFWEPHMPALHVPNSILMYLYRNDRYVCMICQPPNK